MNERNKVREEIHKSEKKYAITPISKYKKEIEDYKNQEKDYIALINEYAAQIKNNVINDVTKEEKEFLELTLNFQNISKKMKEIEKVSRKYTTNRIETVNAENRKKYIYNDLLDEYNELVRMKKLILPEYKKKYNEFVMKYQNNVSTYEPIQEEKVTYDNNQRLGIAPIYTPSNEEYVQMTNQEKKNLENKYYQDMTTKEKISYCEDILNKILYSKNTGKKVYIKIDGNNYYVPKKMKSQFYDYYKKLKLLTNKNILAVDDNYRQVEEENIKTPEETVEEPTLEEQPVIEEDNIVNKYFITTDNNLETENVIPKINIEDNIFTIEHYIQVEEENIKTPEENVVEPVLEEQPTIEEDNISTIDNYIQLEDENCYSNHNIPDETYKVIKTKKSKNRKGLIKRISAAVLALAASLTIVQSIKSSINNNDEIDDISNSISSLDNSAENDIQIEQKINKIIDNSKNPNETKNNFTQKNNNTTKLEQNNEKIKIGDTVCVKEGAPIFCNVYDAMTKANRKEAYFPASKQRSVLGIFIKCNHKFFYCEDQTEIDELMKKGGVIKSYVIGDGGYEGAFHPDDMVKLQTKVKVNKL